MLQRLLARSIAALCALGFLSIAAPAMAANCTGYTTNTSGVTGNGQLEALAEICSKLAAPVLPTGAATAANQTPAHAAVVSADLTRPNNTTTYTASTAWANATSGATYTTFAGVCRANGSVVLMPSIRILDYANQSTKLQGVLWLFHTAPTAINDNATFNLSAADLAKISGQPIPFAVTTVANSGSGSSGSAVASVTGTTYELKCAAADTSLYGLVQVSNAYVPVANEKLTISLAVVGAN